MPFLKKNGVEPKKRHEKGALKKPSKDVVRRVAVVIAVLLACIVPVLFVSSAISYIPLITFITMMIISFVYLQVLVHSLVYSEDSLLDSCERGSAIEFKVHFENRSPLVFTRIEPYFYISDLFGNVATSIPATMLLMPFEKRSFGFDASFAHLGTYSAGVEKIVIYDLLGLFRHTVVNPESHEVVVLPRIFDISRLDLSSESEQEDTRASQPIVSDDMDYAGVREYVWGDPLKTIHWKLSARSLDGNYFTRLFEAFGNPGVSIIIDKTSPEYDSESMMQIFDGIVESALSVNDYARRHGFDSKLVVLDSNNEFSQFFVGDINEADGLMDAMPRLVVDDGRESVELLRREATSIHSQGNVAYCTAHVSEEMISILLEAKLRKHNPILFVVVPDGLEADARKSYLAPLKRLERAGVACHVISDANQIGEAA